MTTLLQDPTRHSFGEGVQPEEPEHLRRTRIYVETKEAIQQEERIAMAALAEKHRKERELLSGEFTARHRQNAINAGLR